MSTEQRLIRTAEQLGRDTSALSFVALAYLAVFAVLWSALVLPFKRGKR